MLFRMLLLSILLSLFVIVSRVESQISTPGIIIRDAEDGVTHRTYVSCGWNVTSALDYSSTPFMYQLGGELFGGPPVIPGSIDISTSGTWSNNLYTTYNPPIFNWSWTTSTYAYNPLGRYAAASAMTAAGTIILWGGKPNGEINDVIYSTDLAKTWNLATLAAPWSERSDMTAASHPASNIILTISGTNKSGVRLNDVWMSSDGYGVWWNQTTPAAPFAIQQEGSAIFLYDSAYVSPSKYSQQYSTLLFFDLVSQGVWSSTNLGTNWTSTYAFSLSLSSNTPRMTADIDNNAYLLVGLTSMVYFSSDKVRVI